MIKRKEDVHQEVIIDLTGPEGNAFVLLGYARRFARDLELTKEESDKLQEDMKSSDYENLVAAFDRAFGEYVTLLR